MPFCTRQIYLKKSKQCRMRSYNKRCTRKWCTHAGVCPISSTTNIIYTRSNWFSFAWCWKPSLERCMKAATFNMNIHGQATMYKMVLLQNLLHYYQSYCNVGFSWTTLMIRCVSSGMTQGSTVTTSTLTAGWTWFILFTVVKMPLTVRVHVPWCWRSEAWPSILVLVFERGGLAS